MNELINLDSYPIRATLKILLKDKTTDKNIIWATDSYKSHGSEYGERKQITEALLRGLHSIDIQPRVLKTLEAQKNRTKFKAEVFTPSWVCNQMNNYCDDDWFGRKNVFNTENDDHTWTATTGKIWFPDTKKKTWQDYVDSRRLEITCGEAPYLVSRYDTTTGELIELPKRIGMLDRKLRIVNENTNYEAEWFKWVIRAYQSTYGYEWQGDNLLIARINLLLTFQDYLDAKWHREPTSQELRKIATIISWNIWQMDGLKNTIPFNGAINDEPVQMSLFDLIESNELQQDSEDTGGNEHFCKIRDWRKGSVGTVILFNDLRKEKN